MQCGNCGEVQDDRYKFCKKCGAPLTRDDKKCLSCGEIVEADAEFCPFCGAALTQTETAAERKPLVIGKKGRYIGALVKAWVMAGLFLLMFGLSFTGFMKVDVSEYIGVEEPIKVSAVDVLEIAFSKKQSLEEVLRKFAKSATNAKDEAAVIRALNKFNVLKFVYSKDVMETAPFSLNVDLILQTTLVLALMLGSLTFAVLFLTEAIMLSKDGKSFLKKDPAGASLGIMTALALFILSMTAGAVGSGPLAAMIIGLSALALNTVYNAVIEGKRPDSTKRLVGRVVSLALGVTLLFTMNCNALYTKADLEKESSYSDRIYTETISEGTSVDGLIVGIDIFAADKDNILWKAVKQTEFDGIAGDIVNGESDIAEKQKNLSATLPPLLYFYAEMNSGYNAVGLTAGIISFVTYFLSGIALSVLLAFIMISLTDYKRKTTLTAGLLALIGFAGMLVVSIICTATASAIVKQLETSGLLRYAIGAAPIINAILATGLFAQSCVLDRKKKE